MTHGGYGYSSRVSRGALLARSDNPSARTDQSTTHLVLHRRASTGIAEVILTRASHLQPLQHAVAREVRAWRFSQDPLAAIRVPPEPRGTLNSASCCGRHRESALRSRQRGPPVDDHKRNRYLNHQRVGACDNRDFRDARYRQDHAFDLRGGDVFPTDLEHILGTICKRDCAIRMDRDPIPGFEPSIGVKGVRRGHLVMQILGNSDTPGIPRTKSSPVSSGSTADPSSRTTATSYSGAGRPMARGLFSRLTSPTIG